MQHIGTFQSDRDLLHFILACFALGSPAIFCGALMLMYLDGYWARKER